MNGTLTSLNEFLPSDRLFEIPIYLIDSNNEGDDETHYDAYDVITAFRTCRASGSQGDETSDFVWCLEGEVDDDVHDDHFPRAGAPSSVSATRPSSWDEDDIRSTWIQNVSEGN